MKKIFLGLLLLSLSGLPSYANSTEQNISVVVNGAFIISNLDDSVSGKSFDDYIELSANNGKTSKKSGFRVRTNLKNWKLVASRKDKSSDINSDDISVKYDLKAGSKANINSATLISNDMKLSDISDNSESNILIGKNKTSLERDPENSQNWLEVRSDYKLNNSIKEGSYNGVVTYNFVSL